MIRTAASPNPADAVRTRRVVAALAGGVAGRTGLLDDVGEEKTRSYRRPRRR